MRKQLVILVSCFILLVALMCGCSKKNAAAEEGTSAKSNTVETKPAVQKPVETKPAVVETTAVETEPETTAEDPLKVNWQGLEYTWEDKSGYTFRAELIISPWINARNEDCIKYNWGNIAWNHRLELPGPEPENWGLKHSSDGWTRVNDNYGAFKSIDNITDVYYCMGNISVVNCTTGWDITSSMTSDILWFSACQPETDVKEVLKHPYLTDNYIKSSTISKVFYDDGATTSPTWASVNPVYTSNSWGPIPFLFVHFDSKTPANPEGERMSEIADTYFCLDGRSPFIWEKEMSEINHIKLDIIE